MAERKTQNLANHVRFDPLFHFFLVPIFAGSTFAAIYLFWHQPNWHTAWRFLLIAGATVAVFKMRLYSLKVQDRVIRLEERLRLASILPASLAPRIGELTEQQLIGLRFASDEEIPFLVEKTLSEKLPQADIKKNVRNWRPDYWRV